MTASTTWIQALGVLLATGSLLSSAARADTLEVPFEYPTIQSAIVAAQPGDSVVVAPGRYVETIDFLGKPITVQSSDGAAVTTIDGGGAGSVVTFKNGETSSSLLDGFTITGGMGSDYKGYLVGGGVKIVMSGPKLSTCNITGNSARDMGGGVYIRSDSGVLATPVLVGCTINANSTTGPTGGIAAPGGGGGVAAHQGRATLTSCTISGNASHGDGGGLAVVNYGGLLLAKCVIEGNQAVGRGGGLCELSWFAPSSDVFLEQCMLRGNVAGFGGGVYALLLSDTLFLASHISVTRSFFLDNVASLGGGGGIWVDTDNTGASGSLESCVVAGNVAAGSGGGVRASRLVFVWNCTIVNNQATTGGGLSASLLDPSRVRQCILWDNDGGEIDGLTSGILYCDVEGGFGGTGNLDVDPHFADPAVDDFHLMSTSACVDAGDPVIAFSSGTDIDGDPRVLFGRIDIGADEATVPKGPWTFLGHALGGVGGAPSLSGTGDLTPGAGTMLSFAGAAPSAPTWLVAGAGQLLQPFKGGVMVPTLDTLIGPVGTTAAGSLTLSGRWPNGIPPGFVVSLQAWIADDRGPSGFTASNGLAAESQ